jgi:hypothetical protein
MMIHELPELCPDLLVAVVKSLDTFSEIAWMRLTNSGGTARTIEIEGSIGG